jgi:uncharacterized membrane protein
MASSTANPPVSATDNALKYCHWLLTAALGLVFAFDLYQPAHSPLVDIALLLLAVVVCITSMNRQIPMQNIALGVCITALIGGLAHGLSALHGVAMPFGPIYFHDPSGARIFGLVPWVMPLVWVVALFSSRGTARVILRPWRKLKSYGYWLIGLTAVLITAFDFALEPFAVQIHGYWSWQMTKIPLVWYGASPLNFFAWAVVCLLILGFATPTLIKKKPGSRTPLDLNPLGIWLGAIVLFAVACARAALWPAVIADGVIAVITLIFAIRGASW